MKKWLTLFILTASLVAFGQEAQNRFETYPVGYSDPAAVEQMIRSVVGTNGNVVMDEKNQRLLVITTDAGHAKIAEMMKTLNVPPRNVRIDVQFKGRGSSDESEISVSGNGEVIHEDGITYGTIKIKPRIIDQTTRTSSDVVQTLLVASGREGFLNVGESVPYLEWLTDYGLRCGYMTQKVAWQNVGARLVVQPTVVGEGGMIRIRLTPELSGLVDGQPLHTRFTKVSTEVVVQDGQTFPIGGLDQDSDFYSHFLIGRSRSGAEQTMQISLTPHIQ